jgi:pimeloyl-ACP methyl ester carboxylesterase
MTVSGARTYTREVVLGDRSVFENWSGTTNRIHRVEWFPPEALAIYIQARHTTDATVVARLLEELPKMFPLPYAAVEVPALVLCGAHSGWRMRVNLQLLVRRLPRASLLTIPGCAHFMANEADAALAEAIGAFAGA